MLTVQIASIQSRDINPSPIIPGRKRKLTGTEQNDVSRKSAAVGISPYQVAKELFVANGFILKDEQLCLLSTLFVKPTESQIAAYTLETMKAARVADINELRRLLATGVSFDCCNRYGESLISLVCRKGKTDIVRFLVKEAKVSLFICDDFGRTVLHDACWTSEPAFDIMDCLLGEVPDLLFVKDVRGHTPLDYARKHHWNEWAKFLQDRKHLMRPRLL